MKHPTFLACQTSGSSCADSDPWFSVTLAHTLPVRGTGRWSVPLHETVARCNPQTPGRYLDVFSFQILPFGFSLSSETRGEFPGDARGPTPFLLCLGASAVGRPRRCQEEGSRRACPQAPGRQADVQGVTHTRKLPSTGAPPAQPRGRDRRHVQPQPAPPSAGVKADAPPLASPVSLSGEAQLLTNGANWAAHGCTSTGVCRAAVPCRPRVTLRLGKVQLPRSSEGAPSAPPAGVSPWSFWVPPRRSAREECLQLPGKGLLCDLTRGQNCDLTANKSLKGFGWGRGWQMGGEAPPPGKREASSRGISGAWQQLPTRVFLLMSEE